MASRRIEGPNEEHVAVRLNLGAQPRGSTSGLNLGAGDSAVEMWSNGWRSGSQSTIFVKGTMSFEADTIEIVDSIPDGEKQTARWIYEHAKDVQYSPLSVNCPINCHRIMTADELRTLLTKLAEEAAAHQDSWPLVHIESHGSTEGVTLAQGDFISWIELQPYFNRLNRATRNHLLVVIAACWGFHGIKAIVGEIDHSASLRFLAGPAGETLSGDIEEAMKAFYSALLLGGSINDCEAAAQMKEPTFRVYSAEQAFIEGWRVLVRELPRSNRDIQAKAEQIVTKVKRSPTAPKRLHHLAKKAIRSLDLHEVFERHKSAFFMLDSFPEISHEFDGVTLPKI
jgi:hypothetical protein